MSENIRGDVMTSAGRTIKFDSESDILCPTCGRNSQQKLKVINTIDNVQHLECLNCGYSQPRVVPASQQPVISRPLTPQERKVLMPTKQINTPKQVLKKAKQKFKLAPKTKNK